MNRLTCLAVLVAFGLFVVATAENGSDMKEQSKFLLNKAKNVIEHLEAQGKHEAAESVRFVEKFLIDVDARVHAFHPHFLIGKAVQTVLEGLLHKGEQMLEDVIRKYDVHDIKGEKGEEDNKKGENNNGEENN